MKKDIKKEEIKKYALALLKKAIKEFGQTNLVKATAFKDAVAFNDSLIKYIFLQPVYKTGDYVLIGIGDTEIKINDSIFVSEVKEYLNQIGNIESLIYYIMMRSPTVDEASKKLKLLGFDPDVKTEPSIWTDNCGFERILDPEGVWVHKISGVKARLR